MFLQACGGSSSSGGSSGNSNLAPVGTVPFVTVWKTDNLGAGDDNQVVIQAIGSGYNYTIDWGDGNVDANLTGSVTHTYAAPGIYTISITGDFPQITTYDIAGSGDGNNGKLLSIEQWGNIRWRSMEAAFEDSSNLIINANDAPDLSQATSTSRMFLGANDLTGDLSGWDVSNITDMSLMFAGARRFNSDLSNWDVSSVKNMYALFEGCENFDADIGNWKTSSVSNMEAIFAGASSFNQDIGAWDVSSVVNMEDMFNGTDSFNQDISAWNVSSVTNMNSMFSRAGSFNGDIASWDVSSVILMRRMFLNADSFDQDIGRL